MRQKRAGVPVMDQARTGFLQVLEDAAALLAYCSREYVVLVPAITGADIRPYLRRTVEWDGYDSRGNQPVGQQNGVAHIGYVYDADYQQTPRFGYSGSGTITGSTSSGSGGSPGSARSQLIFWKNISFVTGPLDVKSQGLGGWTLNPVHFYEAQSLTLQMGGGSFREGKNVMEMGRVVAGTGMSGFNGHEGLAAALQLSNPTALAFDSKGNLFVAEDGRVRVVTPDGRMRTIAGKGSTACWEDNGCGDGGLAINASFRSVSSLALLDDDTLLVADAENHRVRMIIMPTHRYASIWPFAGTGLPGSSGDGGTALEGALTSPTALAVDRGHGRVYIKEGWANGWRIRMVGSDRLLGTLTSESNVASPGRGNGLAVDSAGNVYYGTHFGVFKYNLGRGTKALVLGDEDYYGSRAANEDGSAPILMPSLTDVAGIAVDYQGDVYVATIAIGEHGAPVGTVLKVSGGRVSTVAPGPKWDVVPRMAVGLAFNANGRLFISEEHGGRVFYGDA